MLIVAGSLTYFDIFYILTNATFRQRDRASCPSGLLSRLSSTENFGYAAALGTALGVLAILSAALTIRSHRVRRAAQPAGGHRMNRREETA